MGASHKLGSANASVNRDSYLVDHHPILQCGSPGGGDDAATRDNDRGTYRERDWYK